MMAEEKVFQEMEKWFKEENKEKMKELIEQYGVEMFYPIKMGLQPIYHFFARFNDMEFVTYLLDKGWDINQKDEKGDTALHYVVWEQEIEMFHFLIERGIQIDEKGYEGKTPFSLAIRFEIKEMIQLLYKMGADINVINEKGRKIFSYFDKYDWEYWIPILLEYPGRLHEENLKLVKAKRLELLYDQRSR